MKISIFAGVLLISAAVLSVDGQSWAQFQNKHINPGMTAGQCTQVIAARKIVNPPTLNNPKISCKGINTFISTQDVNAVPDICAKGGGDPYGTKGMTISKASFPIVDCNLVKQNPPAVPYNCRYGNGVPSTKKIIVRCENGKPVHFHGSK
ncbi:ribonuclease pancreatic-like [Perca fluviatilis]|nr:ribonuclease pancreatic-like [Perca fluviatilis]